MRMLLGVMGVAAMVGLAGCGREPVALPRRVMSPEGWMGLRYARGDQIIADEFDTVGGDGKVDLWRYYDAKGKLLSEEQDQDGDGRVDLRRTYRDGFLYYEEADTNGDGKDDTWIRYDRGIPIMQGVDKDQDGRVDLWKPILPGESFRAGAIPSLRPAGKVHEPPPPGYQPPPPSPLPTTTLGKEEKREEAESPKAEATSKPSAEVEKRPWWRRRPKAAEKRTPAPVTMDVREEPASEEPIHVPADASDRGVSSQEKKETSKPWWKRWREKPSRSEKTSSRTTSLPEPSREAEKGEGEEAEENGGENEIPVVPPLEEVKIQPVVPVARKETKPSATTPPPDRSTPTSSPRPSSAMEPSSSMEKKSESPQPPPASEVGEEETPSRYGPSTEGGERRVRFRHPSEELEP